ncbi:histidine--tRNA ligase [Candidatus Kaiserbacteria bacterium]|nr:histidine--tRNA ligase [Candidatus Kaiserbacteria bacterium]
MTAFPKQLLTNPSGFPDLGPAEAIALARMIDVIRKHFELSGYSPIETPLVERTEVLAAKAGGEIAAQIYGLRLLHPAKGATSDEKDLALRFDHTVPLARFVAAHYAELLFPFRRSVIGPVVRGERPQEGRYRQFIQADIDAIGDGSLTTLHDAEMVSVIAGIFNELAIGAFTVRIGNRKVLQGLLRWAGLTNDALVADALKIIDRMEKIGRDSVVAALGENGMAETKARELVEVLLLQRSTSDALAFLGAQKIDELFEEGVRELAEVVAGVRALGVPEERFTVDLSIARGLDYYTGTVYETRLDAHGDLGSIASGGRYEDLASAFTSRKLPGVGISIGVTRLLLRLLKAGLFPAATTTVARVLIASTAENRTEALRAAAALRGAAIACEVYLGSKPLGNQLQYAEKRGFMLTISPKDVSSFTIHTFATGQKIEIAAPDLLQTIQKLLG